MQIQYPSKTPLTPPLQPHTEHPKNAYSPSTAIWPRPTAGVKAPTHKSPSERTASSWPHRRGLGAYPQKPERANSEQLAPPQVVQC